MIWKFDKAYKWLSNFAPCTIVINGIAYPSVEHAFMSAKSNDVRWYLKCTDASIKPGTIKKMSRGILLLPNWDSIKVSVMRDCLNQKFRQEPYKTLLIETGDVFIQEGNFWGDTFWGVDLKSKTGENHLGKLIMAIRDELKNEIENRK
ncbi:MAG: NADAR family protein [Saprospiraceae bacterium]